MTPWTRLTFALALGALAALSVPAQNYEVVRDDGRVVKGYAIEPQANGDLKIRTQPDREVFETVKWGDYVTVKSPTPQEVIALDNLYRRSEWEKTVQGADLLLARPEYRYLGWADEIAFRKGMALAALDKYAEALAAFKQGLDYTVAKDEQAKLHQGMIETYLARQNYGEARRILDTLDTSSNAMIAYGYKVQGQILLGQGKDKEAILSFLKVIVSFGDIEEARGFRLECYRLAIDLLKKLGDNRAGDLEKEMIKEFG